MMATRPNGAAQAASTIETRRLNTAPSVKTPSALRPSLTPGLLTYPDNKQFDQRERERIAKQHRVRGQQMTREARIPARYFDKLGELRFGGNDQWSQTRDLLIGEIVGNGAILVLYGDRGTGKSQMAAVLCAYSCEGLMRRAFFTSASDLVLELQATYKRRDSAELEVFNRYCHRTRAPKLLVIDEFHERLETKYEDTRLTNIIVKRHENGFDTVIVTNQNKAATEAALGPSIVSRVEEGGAFVLFGWASYRSETGRQANAQSASLQLTSG